MTLVPLHVHVFGVRPDRTLSIAQSRLTVPLMVGDNGEFTA